MKSPLDKAHRLFDAAGKAEDEGNLSKALRLYKQVAEIDKNSHHPLLGIADILRDQSQWKDAIQTARKVTKRWPDSHAAYLAYTILGDCYLKQWHLLRAERAYRQALAIEQHPEPWVFLSFVSLYSGRDDDVIACLQNALKIDPHYEEAHYNLGIEYRRRRQYARAERHLRKAIEIDPAYSLAYAELGLLLLRYRKGVRDTAKAIEAVRLLKKSIKLDPKYGWSRAYLANALCGQRKFKAADEQYHKVMEIWPDDSLPYWYYGSFLADRGINDTLAEEYLRKAVKLDPKDSVANYFLGKHLHYWDRNAEAIKFLKKALRQGHEGATKILRKIELQSQKKQHKNLIKNKSITT
jgi:tetratricopeptide (TPR) repeat protein